MTHQFPYVYIWRNNSERAKFHQYRCRIVAQRRARVLLEFLDGRRLVSSINALRKARP